MADTEGSAAPTGPRIVTTVVGAYPKPNHVPISDWFERPDRDYAGRWADEMDAAGDDAGP